MFEVSRYDLNEHLPINQKQVFSIARLKENMFCLRAHMCIKNICFIEFKATSDKS